jgi:uncharacterized protein (TIGR02757 family)
MRRALEQLRTRALAAGRVELDPIRIVLDYPAPEDREVVGLLAALLAYGRVDLLQAHTRELLAHLGRHPARRLRRGSPRLPGLRYRFHRGSDLEALLRGIRALLIRHGSLGRAFAHAWDEQKDLRPALASFVDEIREAAGRAGPGLKFLLADPARGGACKRWLLYLRWMVRCEAGDPDLGLWQGIFPASTLLVPLDTHLVRVSRRLGFTDRRTANWKMAEEVTAALRWVCPEDPVRYDFPLCHLGIAGDCPPRLTRDHCRRCPLQAVCPTGQGHRSAHRQTLVGDHAGDVPRRAAPGEGAPPDSRRAAPLHANIAARSEPGARTEPARAGRRHAPNESPGGSGPVSGPLEPRRGDP